MNLALQNKIKHLRISNISFSPSRKQNRGTRQDHELIGFKNELIKEQMAHKVKPRSSIVMRNSFIPTNHIRTSCSHGKQRKSHEKPIRPASLNHPKFPNRKPLSSKTAKSFIPIYRQRLFSFANTQQIPIDRSSLRTSAKTEPMRATTASCLTLTKKSIEQHQLPPRYARSVKANYRIRKQTQDDRWEQIQKIYF